jgi:rod shape-determining protein MreB
LIPAWPGNSRRALRVVDPGRSVRLLHFSQAIGIDLGTSNVIVTVQGKGIVLREPSVVAVDLTKNRVISIGEAARDMLGRTPGNISAVRPMADGVIANYTVTVQMLEHILHKVCGAKRFFKPQVLLAVPSGITDVQKRAVRQAALGAGAGRAETIEEPMAAAIGAGLPISSPGGNLVVDIGGGTTDIAVLSLDGIVISRSLPVGGFKLDEMIARHIKARYNVAVGDRSAEEIKLAIGSAAPLEREMRYEVRGRDLVTGLPQSVTVTSQEVRDAISESISQIIQRIKHVLEKTPPELASDIMERGITLTGGGALLRGIDKVIAEATHVPTRIADDPISCVALGTARALAERRGIAEELTVLD